MVTNYDFFQERVNAEMFLKINPEVIGNNYFIFGTLEKKAWHENINQSKPLEEMREHIHDFKSYENLRMTMAGWFAKGQTPPAPFNRVEKK